MELSVNSLHICHFGQASSVPISSLVQLIRVPSFYQDA
jgi:hypothetical protein